MTKYQMKRRFINKINKRIKTLVNRAGVNIDDISVALDGIDGVYITDTNNLNIDTSYYDSNLEKRIEKLIPTWTSASETEKQDIIDYADKTGFIGPLDLRESTVNRAIAQRFAADADFEEMIGKYYEWENSVNELDLAGNPNAAEIRNILTDFGSAWAHGRMAESRALVGSMKEYGVNIKELGWNYD